jgi:virulence-associated protein VapD
MVYDGNVTVTAAGTRQRIATVQTMANWITFQPLAANQGSVYLGGKTVSATSGVVITTGDAYVTWPVADVAMYDLREMWIDAANSGDGLQYIYGVR